MRRAVAAVAVLLVIVLLDYRQGGEDRARDQREDTLQRSKDISDAVKDTDAAPDWRDQLRHRHQ
ncbi:MULTISPECIES: hypothetical protein [Roseobacteraceae]|uniref:Uncharacterized protein n=1 Tax=Pseudosulfitobacter pseudonitzschiae TaxID=1402135 RepID=A0A221K0F8_9RHOB|nr:MULTISPECIES: hypothetical protein [Roseobacteraceae]ASM72498.1 hypothetical protein SULPSESMR1_01687 [Pseudosulfitobacter pseudonitzschiae]